LLKSGPRGSGRASRWEAKRRSSLVIILTEAAKSRFRTLSAEGRPEGAALRLDRAKACAPANGDDPRLAVYLAEPEEGDDPIVHGGEPLLYVSRKVSAAFDGCVVDLKETPGGVGFSIGPPEAGRGAR
jgi:Fe-S cluster assembly iron-binding protein IscA